MIKKLKMSDFKEFSKKTTQNQNDLNTKPTEDKTEKNVQPPEAENSPAESDNKEKKE